MKRSNFWYIEQTHHREQYNDSDEYTVITGDGRELCHGRNREILDELCLAHNYCFLEKLPKMDGGAK